MINAKLKSKDTTRVRDSLHRLRDVQSSLNKESKNDVKLYPGRQPSEIKAAVEKRKSETADESEGRRPIAELVAEETVRKAVEAIKEVIIASKPAASAETINKAVREIKKAVTRCGHI